VIEDAVGDRTVAFFMDELEDWFGALDGRRLSANRGFLQALLETTSRTNLFAIVSVLREGSDVHDILSRQTRVEVNMSNQVDIRDVLRHRLVEPGSVDHRPPSNRSSTSISRRTTARITSSCRTGFAGTWRRRIRFIRS